MTPNEYQTLALRTEQTPAFAHHNHELSQLLRDFRNLIDGKALNTEQQAFYRDRLAVHGLVFELLNQGLPDHCLQRWIHLARRCLELNRHIESAHVALILIIMIQLLQQLSQLARAEIGHLSLTKRVLCHDAEVENSWRRRMSQ